MISFVKMNSSGQIEITVHGITVVQKIEKKKRNFRKIHVDELFLVSGKTWIQ